MDTQANYTTQPARHARSPQPFLPPISKDGKRIILLLFVALTVGHSFGFAQNKGRVTRELLCRYYPASFSTITFPTKIETFASNREAEQVVAQIVEVVAGMSKGFEVREAPILRNNAAAAICNDQRYIFYGGDFMNAIVNQTGSYWSAVGVMAHEVGHHIHGHTLDDEGSTPDIELEADHFLGFVLQKLGADIEEAKMAIDLIASSFITPTHPAREKRLAKIEEGWLKSCAADPSCNREDRPKATSSSNIEGAYGFYFTNNCKYPVRVAIRFKNTEGSWQTAGWWNFSPGESAFLSSDGARLISRNSIWYYYAETVDGPEVFWGGDHGVNFRGKYLDMKKMRDAKGTKDWRISCD